MTGIYFVIIEQHDIVFEIRCILQQKQLSTFTQNLKNLSFQKEY